MLPTIGSSSEGSCQELRVDAVALQVVLREAIRTMVLSPPMPVDEKLRASRTPSALQGGSDGRLPQEAEILDSLDVIARMRAAGSEPLVVSKGLPFASPGSTRPASIIPALLREPPRPP